MRAVPSLTIPQDLITDDEIISDSYNLKEVDGTVYEADCKKITIGSENIDIGANPSAEEADEGVEDNSQTVLDVVHSFRLNETQFDKKSYLTHLKSTFHAFRLGGGNKAYKPYQGQAVLVCVYKADELIQRT